MSALNCYATKPEITGLWVTAYSIDCQTFLCQRLSSDFHMAKAHNCIKKEAQLAAVQMYSVDKSQNNYFKMAFISMCVMQWMGKQTHVQSLVEQHKRVY